MTENLDTNKKYLLKYYYIGTPRYFGSQKQPNLHTIEGELIKALLKREYIKDDENSSIEFASRTDKHVSARGACCSFSSKKKPIPIEINTALPEEIGVWAYAEVPNDFRSRYNAIQRHYKYLVYNPIGTLIKKDGFNLNLMEKACKELEGDHDFINFSKKEKIEIKTMRTMDRVDLSIKGDYIIFDFYSLAFLRQQIRRMVKKILELGQGIISYEDFLSLFDPSKEVSYQPANPHGLILWDIKYGEEIKFKSDQKSIERMNNYFYNQKVKYGIRHKLFSILEQNNLS
ncbi:MAG: tRNA pseudouridine(38-40) synthase TruA [Promethearchaeota archaeon]